MHAHAIACDLHDKDERAPVDPRIEADEPTRERRRQHRCTHARKINTRSTRQRRPIERRIGPHKPRCIGNRIPGDVFGFVENGRNMAIERIVAPAHIERLVEVARPRPVDRDKRHVAKIFEIRKIDRRIDEFCRLGLDALVEPKFESASLG